MHSNSVVHTVMVPTLINKKLKISYTGLTLQRKQIGLSPEGMISPTFVNKEIMLLLVSILIS